MLETFYDLDELVDAIAALRSVSQLPIVALLTFDEGAETLARRDRARGRRPARRARPRRDRREPRRRAAAALDALEQMQGDGARLAALPNIGLASLSGGRVIYPHATPDYFAEFAAHARDLGARSIGGCCGTTPTEIAAISARDRREPAGDLAAPGARARARRPGRREEQRETELARRSREASSSSRCSSIRRSAANAAALLDVARRLEELGRRAFVDVNDNARARAGMSSLMVSGAIERATGLETIPHLTTRDSTILGLESMLLGAHAEGVRNILAITGDPPEVGDYPGSRGVYEVDAIGLTAPRPASTTARTSTAARSTRRPPSSSASRSTRRPTTSSSRSSASTRSSRPARSSR